MSQIDKLKRRLLSKPKDFTYSEIKTLLCNLGFEEHTKGKTSGSRVHFYRTKDKASILFDVPHPKKILKSYLVNQIIKQLKEYGDL